MSWWSDNIAGLAQDPTAGGVVGALLSLRFAPGDTYLAKLFGVGGGIALAFFGTAAIVDMMSIQSKGWPGLIGLMLGLLGMNILGKIWSFVATTDLRELINIFRGNRP